MENNKDIFFDINLINDIIDGLADEKTKENFFEHIKECSKCRRMYEEAQKIRAIMKEDGFLPEAVDLPSPDFTSKTMAKIRAAKKPTIIRIINHPAFKTVTAAAACLVIALFVFRSDLFGKIEGANDLANDMIADQQNTVKTYAGEEEFDEAVPENGYTLYSATTDTGADDTSDSMVYSAGAGTSAAAPKSETTSTTMEINVEEEVAEIEEEPIEFEEATEECVPETEESVIEDIAYEEALPEVEKSFSGNETTEDVYDNINNYPYETPEASEPVDPFFSTATNTIYSFSIPDSETEEKVRQIAYSSIARSDLDSGKYEKIILVPAIDEDINWDEIDSNFPNRFFCIDWLSDGEYNYEVFECTVKENEDIVLSLFGANASEILPDIVSGDFSDSITYLILVKTK